MVEIESHRYSLIHVPNPFIVPGGRFRENYYWDSYWIVKGLLVSGMTETVRGMIRNFAHMVETYGFVPNGSRIYYLQVGWILLKYLAALIERKITILEIPASYAGSHVL